MFRNPVLMVVVVMIVLSIVLSVMLSPRIWYGQTKLVPSDLPLRRQFGARLALDEETLLVGVSGYGESIDKSGGAVFVFAKSTSADGWVEQTKLRPADVQNHDRFGWQVAVSGNTLAIAAPGVRLPDSPESNRTSRRGMVYVFTRNGSTWSEQARLVSPDAIVRCYGESIALEGDTLVVGDKGAVHVFVRDRRTNTWSHHTRLTGLETFGPAVALSENTIMVGGSRMVSVFGRDPATGVWQERAQIEEPGSAGFGQAIALKGDTLVVGAYGETQLLYVRTGAAYVFQRDPVRGFWSQQAKLVPQGARVGNGLAYFLNPYGFGIKVAIDQDAIVVSACTPPAPSQIFSSEEQAVYLFRRNQRTGRWKQQAKLMPPEQSQQRGFCNAAVSGNTVLTGAPSEAAEDRTRGTGAVYLRTYALTEVAMSGVRRQWVSGGSPK